MYLGAESITKMNEFIQGYITGCVVNGIIEKIEPDFALFNDYVDRYFQDISTAGWKSKILCSCYGNEREALKIFYEIFDSFRKNSELRDYRKLVIEIIEDMVSKSEIYELIKIIPDLAKSKINDDFEDLIKELEDAAKSNAMLKEILDRKL
jgi:hypothetical protein